MYRIAIPLWSRGSPFAFVHAGRARMTTSVLSTTTVLPRSIRQWHEPGRPLPELTRSFVDAPITRAVIETGEFANWGREYFAGKGFCGCLRNGKKFKSAQTTAGSLVSLFYWTLKFFPVLDGICTKTDIPIPCKVAAGSPYAATILSVVDEPVLVMMPEVPEAVTDILPRVCIDAAVATQSFKSKKGSASHISDPNNIWSMLVAVAGPESVTFQLVEFDQSLLRASTIDTKASTTANLYSIVTYKPSSASPDGALSYFNHDSRLAIGRLLADVAAATEGRVDEWGSRPKPTVRSKKHLHHR